MNALVFIVSEADKAMFCLQQVASITAIRGYEDSTYKTAVSLMNGRDLHLRITVDEVMEQIQAAVLAEVGISLG